MTFWTWLRTRLRGAASPRRAPSTRLALDPLEDRLALSASTATEPAYELWRDQRFGLDQLEIAPVKPSNALKPALTPRAGSNAPPTSLPTLQASGFENVIGLDRVFADYGYRGQGYTVALIDTGVDYRHPALGGGWGNRVLGGWDFVNNDGDPMDDNGHGTHVAGIIGSSSSTYPGVAPNVRFVSLKVLDSRGSGSFGHVEDALRWVINNRARYNIVAVNLSLGAGNHGGNPYTFLEDEFSSLKSSGVFIAAASGNSFYSYSSQQGLSYPAISPQVVAVGAVWNGNFGGVTWLSGARDYSSAADRIASFTQRSAALDIMAPGALITSTYLNNSFRSMAGTSMASPVVAGAAVLIHQALDGHGQSGSANQDYILNLMRSSGVSVTDGDDENDNVNNTGLQFRRLNLHAALSAVQPVNAPPTLAAIPSQSMTYGQARTVTLSASDPNGNPLTYSARALTAAPVAFSFSGNRMTMSLTRPYQGNFSVEVTVSDGQAAARRTFSVTVANRAPSLAGIASQTMRSSQLVVSLNGSDPDGDPLAYSARVVAAESLAYRLDRQLGLSHTGSYYTNSMGRQEKWLAGSGGQWYWLLPNGELRRWAGSAAATLRPAALITVLNASYYADPTLLWNAQPGSAPVAFSVAGNRLAMNLTSQYRGNFTVEVTASDGRATARQTFVVNV